jgi:hypothetical protein
MKTVLLTAVTLVMSGCMTLSGNYVISAYDASGKLLTGNLKLIAQGSGIYTARNGICAAYPKATVLIKDTKTGQELKSESPYKCR